MNPPIIVRESVLGRRLASSASQPSPASLSRTSGSGTPTLTRQHALPLSVPYTDRLCARHILTLLAFIVLFSCTHSRISSPSQQQLALGPPHFHHTPRAVTQPSNVPRIHHTSTASRHSSRESRILLSDTNYISADCYRIGCCLAHHRPRATTHA